MTEAPSSSAVAQKRVLFVDDDAAYLEMIERLLHLWSNNRIETVAAGSASQALSVLQEHPPDVIVVDVCMPVVDGLQLLSMLHRRYPYIPKVVLTGHANETYRTACLDNGADFFLEKPQNSEGFEAIFATLDELTRWKPAAGFSGMLRSVGLTDIIQMECIARNSSLLKVTSKEIDGQIFIRDGAIIHAEVGGTKGEEAFKKLIALVCGDFRSQPFSEPPEESIQAPWESLLMDAAQARDELHGMETDKVPPPPAPAITPDLTPPAASEEPPSPIEIDELVIASDSGDVYHAWKCEDTDLRINLLEFLSQKARLLESAMPLGSFDRAEFISSGSRLIAQVAPGRWVVVRASLSGTAIPKSDSVFSSERPLLKSHVKNLAMEWFEARTELPGLLAANLQFPDRTGPSHSKSPQFPSESIDLLRRCVFDGFQVLKLQRFRGRRARWVFDQIVIESAQWPDSTSLALAFNRHALEINQRLVEDQIGAFLNIDQS